MKPTRRAFVHGASGSVLSRFTPLCAGVSSAALMATTNSANAWVVAALAVASTVAGLIAAHNRSDGGATALLSANYELLKEALKKLDRMETVVTDVLQKLYELPDEIDKQLKQQNTRRLQNELGAVVTGYLETVSTKDPAQTFTAWRKSKSTQRDIGNLLSRLQKSRQELKTEGMIDPSTALVLSPLCLVEHNLLNILDDPPDRIVATLNNVYLPWLDAIVDPNMPLSAAYYTNNAAKRLNDFSSKALNHPFGRVLKMEPGTELFSCAGVNDYAPSHIGKKKIREERVGPRDRLAQSFELKEREFVENGRPSGLKLFDLTLGPELRYVADQPDTGDEHCNVVTADIYDSDARLGAMHGNARWVDDHKVRYDSFSKLVESINTERARYAFGLSTETAKQNIDLVVRNYG
jgi:hypothetical protein